MKVVRLGFPLLVILTAALFAGAAAADRTFRTLHAELKPIGPEPLRSGFVNDIHTNGTVNAAHEIYHLAGASPNTTYTISILLYIADPTCTSEPLTFQTAEVTTNGAGNANARVTFPAGPPSGLEGITHGIRWVFTGPAGPAYATDCAPLTVD